MTDEEAVLLDNIRNDAEVAFAQAAERCRAQAAYEAGERDEPPMGLVALSRIAVERIEDWRAEAERLGVLRSAPANPPTAPDEPNGLTGELALDYRRWRAQAEGL